MTYQNPIMTIYEAECMQKKNFLDHLEVNRKLAAAYSGQRIEGILRRMYDDLRCCEPQLLMFAPFLNSLNLELFPKDLIDVVEYNGNNIAFGGATLGGLLQYFLGVGYKSPKSDGV